MNNSDWLDIDVLEDYLDGKLDAKAMHRIERLSLEDPFVAEALAGLSLSPKRTQSLSILQKQLQDRVAQKPVEEKRWQITSHRLSIAAAAAVLFVTVSLLFWMRESNNRDQLATNKPKKVEAVIAPSEPVKTKIEKVIAEEKATTYANNSKKVKKAVVPPVVSSSLAVPSASLSSIERVSEEPLLRSIEVQKRNELASKSLSTALEGKIAGLQIAGNSIKGTVYGDDKVPLPGASIKLKGSLNGAVTDSKGEFNLALDSALKNQQLTVTSIGYLPKEVNAQNTQNLAIELKADDAKLSEVVIVGYGKAKRFASTGSVSLNEPVGGWKKFEAYVLNNNRLLVDKKLTGAYVSLGFKLNENGEPIDIKAISKVSISAHQTEAAEREAIRLLKEGPKWVFPPRNGSSAELSVNIKF